jgi:hypothetical protein
VFGVDDNQQSVAVRSSQDDEPGFGLRGSRIRDGQRPRVAKNGRGFRKVNPMFGEIRRGFVGVPFNPNSEAEKRQTNVRKRGARRSRRINVRMV